MFKNSTQFSLIKNTEFSSVSTPLISSRSSLLLGFSGLLQVSPSYVTIGTYSVLYAISRTESSIAATSTIQLICEQDWKSSVLFRDSFPGCPGGLVELSPASIQALYTGRLTYTKLNMVSLCFNNCSLFLTILENTYQSYKTSGKITVPNFESKCEIISKVCRAQVYVKNPTNNFNRQLTNIQVH